MAQVDPITKSGIYQIRHIASGKIYIGSASHFRKRWEIHRHFLKTNKHHSKYLQNAWNKHGADAFEWIILEIIENRDDLIRIEQEYLDRLRPFDPRVGYNGSPTAGSNLGIKQNDEWRAKIGVAQLGKKRSPEARAKMSAAHQGRKQSPEAIAKRAAAMIGNQNGKGYRLSPEQRARISKAQRGRKRPPRSKETLAKMSAATKAAMTPEMRERVAASLRRYYAQRKVAKNQAAFEFPDE